MRAHATEWSCLSLFRFRFAFGFRPAACYAWKDEFCICIVAIWLRPSNRLRFGALGWKCQIYSTMATTVKGARQSKYVPRKLAREIKKRAKEKRKEEREKKAKEKKKKDVSAMWQAACVPPDIRRPWDVFREDVSDTWIASLTDEDERAIHEEIRADEELREVQRLGALRAFQALPACRHREYAEVSLQELSAFAAWSATCGPADAMERVAAWTGLEPALKAGHVPHNWRALLAKDPTWHVLIADDVKEEVEVPIGAAPALGGAPARVSSPSAQTPPKPPLPPALVAADGSYPAYGLKIKQPWMGHILRGKKIWEIRGEEARVIGRVALFEAGAMHFVGLATIVESNLVTDADMAANVDKHCIEDWDTNPMVAKYRERKGIFAYVLSDVVSIEPVTANLGSSVIWSILANWLTMPSAPNAAGATRVGGAGAVASCSGGEGIGADEKSDSLLPADGDVSSLVVGECAAGAVVLRQGRVVVATRTRGEGRKSTPGAVDGDKKHHKPARRRPASPAFNHAASGVSPAAAVAGYQSRPRQKAGARRQVVAAKWTRWPQNIRGGEKVGHRRQVRRSYNRWWIRWPACGKKERILLGRTGPMPSDLRTQRRCCIS